MVRWLNSTLTAVVKSVTYSSDLKLSNEEAQGVTRVLFSTLVFFLLTTSYLMGSADPRVAESIFLAISYVVISLLDLYSLRRMPVKYGIRRTLVLCADVAIISYAVSQFSLSGLAFYPFYLWIVVGYTLRYGERYLYPAIVTSLTGLVTAANYNGSLASHSELILALLAALVILPIQFISIMRSNQQAQLRLGEEIDENYYLSNHDHLTGLSNRYFVEKVLGYVVEGAESEQWMVTVVVLDIDHFSNVNDGVGHATGDELLRQFAQRINALLTESDLFSRMGGDNFLLVLKVEWDEREDVVTRLKLIEQEAKRPYAIATREFYISLSIGIAEFPSNGNTAEQLIRNADIARAVAKRSGGDRICYYEKSMAEGVSDAISMQSELRRALEREEFLLYYQPQVALASGQLVGLEALIRWQHPKLGFVPPNRFISVAEQCGMIDQIGDWVLRAACHQHQLWHEKGLATVPIAVNLSAHQLKGEGLLATVSKYLAETGMKPEQLELEVTESVLMEDIDQAVSTLSALRKMGVGLAMDDFGTGYSSLSYLQRFPFSKLKIDRAFVTDVTKNPDQSAISRTILAMGQSLRLKVLAEGVETTEQANYLRRNNCRDIQGYLVSPPVPPVEIEERFLQQAGLVLLPVSTTEEADQKAGVLIIDDDIITLKALKGMLSERGYRVYTAQSTNEGFNQMANHAIAIAIADDRMPQIGGVNFLSHIRSLYPETVRILLTAYADVDVISRAVNKGAVYKFLTKEDIESKLFEVLDEAMQLYINRSVA